MPGLHGNVHTASSLHCWNVNRPPSINYRWSSWEIDKDPGIFRFTQFFHQLAGAVQISVLPILRRYRNFRIIIVMESSRHVTYTSSSQTIHLAPFIHYVIHTPATSISLDQVHITQLYTFGPMIRPDSHTSTQSRYRCPHRDERVPEYGIPDVRTRGEGIFILVKNFSL